MVERICKRDLLPPIESELAGKDWRTLEGLATYYFKKAFRQERYSHTTLGSIAPAKQNVILCSQTSGC